MDIDDWATLLELAAFPTADLRDPQTLEAFNACVAHLRTDPAKLAICKELLALVNRYYTTVTKYIPGDYQDKIVGMYCNAETVSPAFLVYAAVLSVAFTNFADSKKAATFMSKVYLWIHYSDRPIPDAALTTKFLALPTMFLAMKHFLHDVPDRQARLKAAWAVVVEKYPNRDNDPPEDPNDPNSRCMCGHLPGYHVNSNGKVHAIVEDRLRQLGVF